MRLVTVADAAAVIRGRRLDRGLSQAQLAILAGVSRRWLTGFETGGSQHAELGTILRVLNALGLDLDAGAADTAASASAVSGVAPALESTTTDTVDLDALLDRLRDG